jgi:hypothetical protein
MTKTVITGHNSLLVNNSIEESPFSPEFSGTEGDSFFEFTAKQNMRAL